MSSNSQLKSRQKQLKLLNCTAIFLSVISCASLVAGMFLGKDSIVYSSFFAGFILMLWDSFFFFPAVDDLEQSIESQKNKN